MTETPIVTPPIDSEDSPKEPAGYVDEATLQAEYQQYKDRLGGAGISFDRWKQVREDGWEPPTTSSSAEGITTPTPDSLEADPPLVEAAEDDGSAVDDDPNEVELDEADVREEPEDDEPQTPPEEEPELSEEEEKKREEIRKKSLESIFDKRSIEKLRVESEAEIDRMLGGLTSAAFEGRLELKDEDGNVVKDENNRVIHESIVDISIRVTELVRRVTVRKFLVDKPFVPPWAEETLISLLGIPDEGLDYILSESGQVPSSNNSNGTRAETSQNNGDENYPRNAVWHGSQGDQPIVITGSLAEDDDGKKYYKIEGSNIGVPVDEVEFTPTNSENEETASATPRREEEIRPDEPGHWSLYRKGREKFKRKETRKAKKEAVDLTRDKNRWRRRMIGAIAVGSSIAAIALGIDELNEGGQKPVTLSEKQVLITEGYKNVPFQADNPNVEHRVESILPPELEQFRGTDGHEYIRNKANGEITRVGYGSTGRINYRTQDHLERWGYNIKSVNKPVPGKHGRTVMHTVTVVESPGQTINGHVVNYS